jgi:hypothetical protein
MIDAFEGMRKPRILIPDNTPLSLLAMVGPKALDWLFTPGAEVWVTDMAREEALRDPDYDDDQRIRRRRDIADWLARNADRIHIQATDEGKEYHKAMEAWRRVPGQPLELRPAWKGRGERSILQVLDSVEDLVAEGEAVVVIVDDRRARAAVRTLENVDIDVVSTEAYLAWISVRFDVKEAATAWRAIRMATDDKAPPAPTEDPEHLCKIR